MAPVDFTHAYEITMNAVCNCFNSNFQILPKNPGLIYFDDFIGKYTAYRLQK